MVGKLPLNSNHSTRGLAKYVPGRGYFRAVSSQNGDKFVTSPTPPPIVERVHCRFRCSPPFFVYPFVYISFQFPVFVRSPHIRATVQFRSVFQFIFLSGGLRDQWVALVRVSAIIYDYFFESVYACRLCKTQRGPSLARVRVNLSPTITFSDDTVGKHSRAFTTPRVVPFLLLSIYFIFYYPFNVQPRFQTILQTPLHLAFSWLGLWSTVKRAERFRLILVHSYHPPLVC